MSANEMIVLAAEAAVYKELAESYRLKWAELTVAAQEFVDVEMVPTDGNILPFMQARILLTTVLEKHAPKAEVTS